MTGNWLEEQFGLCGRVALVTGSSGDLGGAIAHGLGGAGATVALHGTSVARLERRSRRLREAGIPTELFALDLRSQDAAHRLIGDVVDRFGRLDVLVNCAGVNSRKPALDVTPEDYARVIDLNQGAAFYLCQAAGRVMIPQGGGKIINIGSLTNTLGLSGISVYGMAKAGLGQLTRTLAIEWAPHNVQVNCISPGFFRTAMTEEVWQDERRVGWLRDHIPIRRAGSADELAGVAVFLSSHASSYVTGQTVAVDGGVLAGIPGYGASDGDIVRDTTSSEVR